MKRTRTKILAGVALLIGLIAVVGIVGGQATRTTIAGYVDIGPSVGGEWWESGPISHGRGVMVNYDVYDSSDTLIGTGSGVVNVNYNRETGDGQEWGSMTFDMTLGGVGTFEGRFSERISNWYVEGQVVLHGTGDSAGLMAKGSFAGPWLNAIRPFELVILDPHGE